MKKIVEPYFISCPSYALFCYVLMKTKFENVVCIISQKLFELEPFIFGILIGAEEIT